MLHILIVDDSVFSQKVTSNLLKKKLVGLDETTFYFANDGEEGFEKYKQIKPDYVFLDLLMPKINGIELTRMLNEYDKAAKIFVVSADVQKNVKDEIDSFEVKAFINKPFNEEKAQEVCEIIRNDKND